MSDGQNSVVLLERIARLMQNDSHSVGLKPTQWEALRFLARANRFSKSPSALTAYLGMTKGTVSQTLNALERKALIEKTTDGQDRRNVKLALTKAGRSLLTKDPMIRFSLLAKSLDKSARDGLSVGLEKLLRQALQDREGRAFGACKTCRYFVRRGKAGAPHYCRLLEEPLSVADSEQICVEQEAVA